MTTRPPMILGIDAGANRLKAAVSDAQGQPTLLYNTEGEPTTQSVVHFAREGGTLVGREAFHAGYAEPERTVSNWKAKLGSGEVLHTGDDGRRYTAGLVLAIFLVYLRETFEKKLEAPPEDVVISHPADWEDAKKQALLTAAKDAGLKVLKLIPEPTAAALGNQVHQRGIQRLAVFDLGGLTFDVSLAEVRGSRLDIVRTGGIAQLGGRDFNQRILERVLQRFEAEHGFRPDPGQHALFFQEAAGRIEQAKLTLSARPEARVALSCDGNVINLTISRKEFEEACRDLTEQTMQCFASTMEEAGWTPADLDEIHAVGGASRMPMIAREIEARFERPPAEGVEPDYAAAYGNVIACRLERERQGRPLVSGDLALPPLDRSYQDVTGQPVGVAVLNRDGGDLVNAVLLDKGMPIPSEQTQTFALVEAHQTDALIELLQGANGTVKSSCAALGHFKLTDLPARQEIEARIEIRMQIDTNGMLSAVARDLISGKTADLRLDYGGGNGDAGEAV